MSTPRSDRFFIAGCQRSGTTMLRLVLECHPDIFCLDEDTSYPALMRGECPKPSQQKLTGFKVPRWTEQFDAPLARDLGEQATVCDFYHGEPILYLVRDVRDNVASMLKLKMTETDSWLEVCGRPIVENKIAQPEFASSYAEEIVQLRASGNAWSKIGALYWKYKTDPLFRYRKLGWPVLLIRYEDLVESPRWHLRQIVEFLGLRWSERLLQHDRLPHSEIYADGTAMGNTDPRKPIHDESVGQWRRMLKPEDEKSIMQIVGDLPARLGYGQKQPGLGQRVRKMWRRMVQVMS
jgi:hypothetical protein